MKRPGVLQGAGVALLLAVLSSVVFPVLQPVLSGTLVLRGLIALTSLIYIAYLLRRSDVRIGKITTVASWMIVSIVIWLLSPPLIVWLLTYTGFIWLVRSFYFHSSILTSLADLGLSSLAIAAAVWAAMQSGSLFLSVWCFFLVQALFALVPARWTQQPEAHNTVNDNNEFVNAYRNAEAALRKLSSVYNR